MRNLKNNKLNTKTNNFKPSKELLEALKEGKTISKELKSGKRKGYNNMNDLINSLNID